MAHLLNDRASRLIACLGLGVTLCLILLGAYLIRDLRDGTWRQAEQNAENLLTLIEEGVAQTVAMYDLSLQAAAERAARADVGALHPEIRRLVLFERAATASGLGLIAVTDAAGQVRLTSDPGMPTGQSFADLPEFATHRADPAAGLVISGPRPSRLTGRPIMSMSRSITNPDGSFGGIVIGAIFLDHFQALFARLHIAEGSAINLLHADGRLLVKEPYSAASVGRSIADGESYGRFRASARGLFVGWSPLVGTRRLYAFANLKDLPLLVNVAVGVDGIRAGWMSKAAMIASLIAGLSIVTLGLTLVLQREISRRAGAEISSRAANAELSRLALTDSLTGLPNRRRYDDAFAKAWRRAVRIRGPIALLLLDTDHFKQFNDRFGHPRGDEVLRAVAGCMLRHLDGIEAIACRIGGEEFAVILPDLQPDAARAVAEQIRRAVVDLQIPHAPDIGGVATISIGLAHRTPSALDGPGTLFAEADAALYAAKRAGRNRVRSAVTSAADAVSVACRA
ncbi:diguanylate cyclase domain-containing protein [uncultured Methylobacterium sp.]|uniref:sensor domain-containing diguanylate cyclase n=1 Tax=uncultured Methylobacterium sp. TaxID=157278 RepID=UPI0035CA1654